MALLEILKYPDPRLHKIAAPVSVVNGEIQELVKNMIQTMYAAPGIGLAAPQVNVLKQVVVIDISDSKDQLHVFINPVITASFGEEENEEGCLSVPDIYDRVRRATKVTVQAIDIKGNRFELQAEGLLAVCIQHEIDHLKGKVFVEYLSKLKQTRLRDRLKKQLRKKM